MAVEWKSVTIEDARQKSYYGFGGWMWPLYGLLLYLIWVRLSMVFRVPQYELETMFESARQAEIMEYFAFLEIILWLPFLVLAPISHRLMPRLAICGFCAWWVLQAIVMLVFIDIAAEKIIVANVISTIITVLYVLYLSRSKRVNLTCRLRERVT